MYTYIIFYVFYIIDKLSIALHIITQQNVPAALR